jgi:hypothetical protein
MYADEQSELPMAAKTCHGKALAAMATNFNLFTALLLVMNRMVQSGWGNHQRSIEDLTVTCQNDHDLKRNCFFRRDQRFLNNCPRATLLLPERDP